MSSYTISVSLGTGCYRHIKISSRATLYRLHKAILGAFDFDDDHEHAFFMDNRTWSDEDCFVSSKLHSGDRVTKGCSLEKLELSKGDRFKYLFDFGDEWLFQCKVLQELDEETAKPVVIKHVGVSPDQYPQWEEEAENEELLSLTERLDQEMIDRMFGLLPLDGATRETLHLYFDAAVNLYGVIPVSKLLEIYNSQNEPIPDEQFYAFVQILRHEQNDYLLLSREEIEKGKCKSKPEQYEAIMSELLDCGTESYFGFIDCQGEKPYKILPKEEFLCYARPETYPQTVQSAAMLRFLRQRRDTLTCSPEDACRSIHLLISVNSEMQDTLEFLMGIGLQLRSQEDVKTFLMLYMEMANHTRMQVNRGYMPCELIEELSGGIFGDEPCEPDNQISLFDDPQAWKDETP